jgi:hypothetical protein
MIGYKKCLHEEMLNCDIKFCITKKWILKHLYCSNCYNKPENAHLLKQRSADVAKDEAHHKQYVEEYGSDDDFEYFFWFEFLPQETAADKVVSK